MTIAFVQQVEKAQANATSIVSPTLTVTAGDTLVIMVNGSFSGRTPSMSGGSNTFVTGAHADDGFGGALQVFVVENASGGTYAITATDTGATLSNLYVAEYSGTSGTGCYGGSAGQAQSNLSTTAADAVSSTSFSLTSAPAMIVGLSMDENGTPAPSVGTGFTSRTAVWAGNGPGQPEDKRVTATGSYAATWTLVSGNQFDSLLSVVVGIKEAGAGGGAAPFTPNPTIVSTPVLKNRNSSSDIIVQNLLATTLLLAVHTLSPGKQLHTSAPVIRQTTACEQQPNLLPIKSAPVLVLPQGKQLQVDPKSGVQRPTIEPAVNRLALTTIVTAPPGKAWFDSAPALKGPLSAPTGVYGPIYYQAQSPVVVTLTTSAPPSRPQSSVVDPPSNLALVTPPAVIPPGQAWFASAPYVGRITLDPAPWPGILYPPALTPVGTQRSDASPSTKPQIGLLATINTLPLGVVQQPAVVTLSASAPTQVARSSADAQVWQGYYPPTPPTPQVRQQFESAPPLKTAVTIDQLSVPATLAPPPVGQQRSESAPPKTLTSRADGSSGLALTTPVFPAILTQDASAPRVKAPVQVDAYPNLFGSTLPPAPSFPIPLPLGLPVDVSQWQAKGFVPGADQYPNTALVLGIPPALPDTTSHRGGQKKKHHRAERPKLKEKPYNPDDVYLEISADVPTRDSSREVVRTLVPAEALKQLSQEARPPQQAAVTKTPEIVTLSDYSVVESDEEAAIALMTILMRLS